MQTLLRTACFAAMIGGGIWPVFAFFRKAEPVPTTAAQLRAEHAQLQCFANGVLRSTPPGAAIRFVVPADDDDGGLINHRLRYVVPGRYIVTDGAPRQFVASWRQPAADGTVVFRGCGGVLVRQ